MNAFQSHHSQVALIRKMDQGTPKRALIAVSLEAMQKIGESASSALHLETMNRLIIERRIYA